MKRIILTNHPEPALVGDDDYDFLNQFEWVAKRVRNGSENYHAVREIRVPGNKVTIRMHRLIVEARPDQKVTHINNNTLDNRRGNLQIHTQRPFTGRPFGCGFRGVHQLSASEWSAQIEFCGRTYELGKYPDPVEAAKIYDKAAVGFFGVYASTNFQG